MRRCKKYGEYNRRARSKREMNMVYGASSPSHHYECFGVLEVEKSQDATVNEEPSIITGYD